MCVHMHISEFVWRAGLRVCEAVKRAHTALWLVWV